MSFLTTIPNFGFLVLVNTAPNHGLVVNHKWNNTRNEICPKYYVDGTPVFDEIILLSFGPIPIRDTYVI